MILRIMYKNIVIRICLTSKMNDSVSYMCNIYMGHSCLCKKKRIPQDDDDFIEMDNDDIELEIIHEPDHPPEKKEKFHREPLIIIGNYRPKK